MSTNELYEKNNMMKKIFIIIFIIFLSMAFEGCENNTNAKETRTKGDLLECSMCGLKNNIENDFCSACGCGLKPSSGYVGEIDDGGAEYGETIERDSVLNYLKKSEKPLIVYECDIAKDAKITATYVIKNGKCRLYRCPYTLGELSKMTDDEILEMLEKTYQDGLKEAVSKWKGEPNTCEAISQGKVKVYEPRSYDIRGCLYTDESGNNVVGELLFFPEAGVGGSRYVIEYNYSQYQALNYFGTSEDYDSSCCIKFNKEYFHTGYGTRSDLNEVNNLYYLTSESMTCANVYDSTYYGFCTKDSDWSNGGDTLCFRVDNSFELNLTLDSLSSTDVSYVDPDENDLLVISHSYYDQYYSSFKTLK